MSVFNDVAPWPDQPTPAEAVQGHNRPPIEDDVRAQFKEQLLDERPDFLVRVDDIEAASQRVDVSDDDTLGRAGDLVKMIRAAQRHVTETHKAVKAPYLAAGRTCDGEKNTLIDRLDDAKARTEKPMNAYVAEQARKRREAEEARRQAEEERRRAEAEAAAANEPAPAPTPEPYPEPIPAEPMRSDGGTTISTRTQWHAEVQDFTVAFIAVEDDEGVRAAVQKAIDKRVRAGVRKIEGVRIYSTEKAVSV